MTPAWSARTPAARATTSTCSSTAARAVVERVLGDDPEGRVLTVDETGELLATYGISLWPVREAGSADEAVAVAVRVGGLEQSAQLLFVRTVEHWCCKW